MNAARRALAMLVDPGAEWASIESEAGDPAYVLSRYVAVLALVPAVFGFIGVCVVGVIVPSAGMVRAPIFNGLFGAIFGYVLGCATVLLLGIIINLLAPLFGGRRDFDSAFKLAVYSFTPVWLAGLFLVLPGLHFLTLTGFYGAYLLWLGLPRLTKSPAQKSLRFTALIVVCASCCSTPQPQRNASCSARRDSDYGAITICLHAAGRPASVSGGFGLAGTVGGAGCSVDSLNQKSSAWPQPSPSGTGGCGLHSRSSGGQPMRT